MFFPTVETKCAETQPKAEQVSMMDIVMSRICSGFMKIRNRGDE